MSDGEFNCQQLRYIMSVRHPLERSLSNYAEMQSLRSYLKRTNDGRLLPTTKNELFRGLIEEMFAQPTKPTKQMTADEYRHLFLNGDKSSEIGNANKLPLADRMGYSDLLETFDLGYNESSHNWFFKRWASKLEYENWANMRNVFSNYYTRWIGCDYDYSDNNFDKLKCYRDYNTSNLSFETNLKKAIRHLMSIDFVLPVSTFLEPPFFNRDTNESLIVDLWRIFQRSLNWKNGGEQTETVKQGHVSEGELTSKGMYAILTEIEKQLYSQYNRFDLQLYNISKMIGIADLSFYRSIQLI